MGPGADPGRARFGAVARNDHQRLVSESAAGHQPARRSASMRAIVRVRLAPWLRREAFEGWLRALRPVEWAALLTGDADYELHVECRSLADLGDALTRIRAYRGVEVESSALILHEVTGLGWQRRGSSDGVTIRRLRTM